MKAFTEYLTMHTQRRKELVHLTPQLDKILAKSGIYAELDGRRDKRLVVKIIGI